MNRLRDSHTESSKSYRKRQISQDIAYMWNLKKKGTNQITCKIYSHRYRKQTMATKGK